MHMHPCYVVVGCGTACNCEATGSGASLEKNSRIICGFRGIRIVVYVCTGALAPPECAATVGQSCISINRKP